MVIVNYNGITMLKSIVIGTTLIDLNLGNKGK